MPGHTRLVVVMSPVHGGEEEVRGGVMVTEAVELRGEEEEQGRRRRRRGRRSISSWSNRKCRSLGHFYWFLKNAASANAEAQAHTTEGYAIARREAQAHTTEGYAISRREAQAHT